MGSTKQSGTSQTKTQPWQPTIEPLEGVIGQIQGQSKNTAVTGNENQAFDTLTQNAQAGNPYAGQIGNLATDLFAGGTDRTGAASANYDAYKSALTPTATAVSDPWSNPAFAKAIGYLSDDITNRVKGEYAGAGRDPSGAGSFGLNLGEGIARGVAPTWLNAYNDMEGRRLGAIDSIYSGGNSTTGLLNRLDQTALGNRNAGIGVGNAALDANNYGANAMLGVEGQRRNLPLSNIGNLEQLLTPLAQLGGKSNTNTTQTTTPPLGMQIVQGASSLMNAGKKAPAGAAPVGVPPGVV